jgi:hypothetical protein
MANPLYTLDWSPLERGMNTYRQGVDDADKSEKFRNALVGARGMPGIQPQMIGLAESLGPDQGPNALFQAYAHSQQNALAQQQRAMAERQFGESVRMHDQTLALQRQQEARAAQMTPYDIQVREAQARSSQAEAENKGYMTGMMRDAMGGSSQPPQGVTPPLPPSRGPSGAPMSAPLSQPLPGPQMQPQSGDGFDPSMVRPIADTQQPLATQQPGTQAQPRMVETPFGTMPIERAQKMTMAFHFAKNEGAAKAMQQAIDSASLGKHTQDKVGEKAFNTGELSARLDGIAGKFKPEYQTYETSARMGVLGVMDSFESLRSKIPPAERQKFAEYTAYRQESIDNLSNYIKEITGAAMGIQEEKRIRMGMPDPVKDSPTQFQAKLENSMRMAKTALARHNYLIAKGYDPKALGGDKLGDVIKLDDMPRIINQRGAELKQKILSEDPQADGSQIDRIVADRVKKEFGI